MRESSPYFGERKDKKGVFVIISHAFPAEMRTALWAMPSIDFAVRGTNGISRYTSLNAKEPKIGHSDQRIARGQLAADRTFIILMNGYRIFVMSVSRSDIEVTTSSCIEAIQN